VFNVGRWRVLNKPPCLGCRFGCGGFASRQALRLSGGSRGLGGGGAGCCERTGVCFRRPVGPGRNCSGFRV